VGKELTVFYFRMMNFIKKSFYSVLVVCLIIACSSDTEDDIIQINEFDRSEILTNYVDNIIIPRHNDFKSEIDNLKIAVDEFVESPISSTYDNLHNQWLITYKKWQHIEMFNIGKAEEINFLNTINTYPVDELRINENIDSRKFNLTSSNDWSCQGLSGIDYMLHGIDNSKENVILKYSNNSNYGEYLKNLLDIIINNTDQVVNHWSENKNSFVNSSGNSNTSSLNMLTNDFVYYFEKGLRTNKIGIPVGYFSGGNVFPDKVEAYYSSKNSFNDVSKELAKEALIASENLFTGRSSSGSKGPSLKTYLDYIYSADVNKNNLSPIILSNFQSANDAINELDKSFVNQISSDKSKMLNAFDKLQALVVNMKTDMLSILSIQVDYIDADGD
jgi:predicted lipoprotein